jgi:Domain of unknown function (DUF5658)
MPSKSILKVENRFIFYVILGILFILDNVSTYLALRNSACIEGNPLAVPFVLNLSLNLMIKIVALSVIVFVFELMIKLGRYFAKKCNWTNEEFDNFYIILLVPLIIFIGLFLTTVISNFSCYLTGKILLRTFF